MTKSAQSAKNATRQATKQATKSSGAPRKKAEGFTDAERGAKGRGGRGDA